MIAISLPIQPQCAAGKNGVMMASTAPPTAAVASPTPKPSPVTRSVLMPTSRAACGCWMVARSDWPNRVTLSRTNSAPSVSAAMPKPISRSYGNCVPARSNDRVA